MNKFVIETKNISKYFRTQMTQRKIMALESLNLSVESGEIFGFLGPNGAGKTTAIKLLTNLIFPTSGEAFLFEKPASDVLIRRRVGYLPEHPCFYPHLAGHELLSFCCSLHGLRCSKAIIEELLATVGLHTVDTLLISKYSKGMVQRLGIAQALVNDPDLVIFDEPMEGLDPIGRRDVRDIMLDLKKKGKTIFFSSHILPDVEIICDRVGILLKGKLISVGRIDELLKKSIESYEVTCQHLTDEAILSIGRNALQVNRSGQDTQFVFTEPEAVDRALGLVRQFGGRLVSLQPRSKTLEEHFITEVLQTK